MAVIKPLDEHKQVIIQAVHVIHVLILFVAVFQSHLGSDYDLERIIDDWILMGFLVGNDFIPHLPNLHINHDALPLLYKTYISVLPTLGGEAQKKMILYWCRFESFSWCWNGALELFSVLSPGCLFNCTHLPL